MLLSHRHSEVLDPIDAYDRLASSYADVSKKRERYLDAIVRLIVGEIPQGSGSLLDVGAGDGVRADRIAAGAGLSNTVLLEPASAMRRQYTGSADIRAARAEELHRFEGRFDVITCLWNVLGHVLSAAARREGLRQFGRLLAPQGRVFIDVNHRYNARHYGVVATAARLLRDATLPNFANGDVRVTWKVAGAHIVTRGHVFTQKEFTVLAKDAGLSIEKRFIVDYRTGELRKRSFEGNFLYVMRQTTA